MHSPQIDCGGGEGVVGGGGKRRMEGKGEGETEAKRMKRVAELVLVMSAMGKMRGGREPTAVEMAMMAEARKKVASLCEVLSPKDILPREVFSSVVDDLGLNRLRDQRLGFRPPKLPISDRIALAKRRMEESKAFASQSAPYTSERLQSGNGAASENRGTPPPVPVQSTDKVGPTRTFQPPNTTVVHTPPVQTSSVHVTTAASAPLPAVTAPRNVGKDSTTVVPTRTDRAHLRSHGRPNWPSEVPEAHGRPNWPSEAPQAHGRPNWPSEVPHVPASSPADRHNIRTNPDQIQPQPHPQPPSRVNIGAKNKAPDQLPSRVGNTGGTQMAAQPAVVQTPKPVASQTAPGSTPTMHHNVQGSQFASTPAINHHVEISKVVQRLLNPKLPPRPIWTPPSREYMNKAHPCQFCKLIINDVETVVICDACEKAFHLGCLQSHNVKSIPKGEWHCPRCLAMSHGKPFPPKYGRVTRNMNAPKASSNTSVSHFQSEKKMQSVNEKLTPNPTTNGSVNVRLQSQPVNVAQPSYGLNLSHGIDASKTAMSVATKKEVAPNMGSGPTDKIGTNVGSTVLTSVQPSTDKPLNQIPKSEVSHPRYGFISETKSSTPIITHSNSASENLLSSSNQNDIQQKPSNCDESQPSQHNDSNKVVECYQNYNEERCGKGVKQNMVVTDKVQDQAREGIENSESELYHVDWIGEIDKVADGKNFFRSCSVNGVVYHVQSYALFRSNTGKLTPFRLQGMWEDSEASSKWLIVHKCYFPDDLPGEVGRPGGPQINEVYESTHDSIVKAGSVQGPCEVLPFRKFGEQADASDPGALGNGRMGPVFVRNWFYDESKRAFCPSAS